MKIYKIPLCADFNINGHGDGPSWGNAPWQELSPCPKNDSSELSRCKLLYSSQGLYVFFECEDQLLQSSGMQDGDDLYLEDVFEIFLQPDEKKPLYLEYEVSPLGAELPLLISKCEDEFMGWSPWKYDGGDNGEIRHDFYQLTDAKKMTGPQWHFAGPTRPVEELYDCKTDSQKTEKIINNNLGTGTQIYTRKNYVWDFKN